MKKGCMITPCKRGAVLGITANPEGSIQLMQEGIEVTRLYVYIIP